MFNRQRLRRLPLDIQLEVETLLSDLRGEGRVPLRHGDEADVGAVGVAGLDGGFTADAFSATMSAMDLAAFRASLTHSSPPLNLSPALRALWLEARGDWDGAHDSAQADEGGAGDWVHAYLHRKEGDAGKRRLLVPPRPQAGLPDFARRRMGGDRERAAAGREEAVE